GIADLRREVEQHRPDLIVADSLPALQGGEENSNTDRRHFYQSVIAPVKSEFSCGFILTAHPPLPSKAAPTDAKKRPRGAGDSLAFTDRASWLEGKGALKTGYGDTHCLTLHEYISREGGGLDELALLIEDTPGDGTVVRVDGNGGGVG